MDHTSTSAKRVLAPDDVRVHVSLGSASGVLGPNEMRLRLDNMLPGGLRLRGSRLQCGPQDGHSSSRSGSSSSWTQRSR